MPTGPLASLLVIGKNSLLRIKHSAGNRSPGALQNLNGEAAPGIRFAASVFVIIIIILPLAPSVRQDDC